jgi:hypothetical protein
MTDDQYLGEREPGPEDLTGHELRSMLHRAVADVLPDPEALPRIQRAVPRRRARQRNTWTGAAAAVLLTAAAVPAIQGVRHLDLSGGPAAARTVAESDRAGETIGTDGDGTTGRPYTPGPAGGANGRSTPTGVDATSATGSLSTGGSGTQAPSVPLPGCARADLGRASSHLGAADSSGKVYGWFTVLNTSGRSCELTGAGTVLISAVNGTDPAKVKVVDHTAGDPAAGLPDPAPSSRALVLAPQAGYQVQFGWVPDASCPSPAAASGTTGAAGPNAAGSNAVGSNAVGSDPAGSSAVFPSTGSSPDASTSPTPAPSPSPSSTTGAPSITLAHTPASGGPAVATAVVDGACAGTVYRAAPQAVGVAPASPVPTAG